MILHTTPPFLIVTITPHLPTSQHLMPRPYRTKLSRHHLGALPASSPFCNTIPSTPPESSFLIPKYLRTFLRRDRWESYPRIPHLREPIVQTPPTYPFQRGFGDFLRPVASMHPQVTTEGQPILMTSLFLASEDPEVNRRPVAHPFHVPNFHLRLVASLWVWVWVRRWHLCRSARSRSLCLQHSVLCIAVLFWIAHLWSGEASWPMDRIRSTA